MSEVSPFAYFLNIPLQRMYVLNGNYIFMRAQSTDSKLLGGPAVAHL